MDKIGYIEIRISGSKGNLDLSPDNYDIREIILILENAEKLINPDERRNRPTITYQIEAGSVRHIFKTSIQYIIGFNAVLGQIKERQNIDFLDSSTAIAFENIQELAYKNDYLFKVRTSLDLSNELTIDKSTRFHRTETTWADAEFYFYGRVTNAGGKDKANIHLYTDKYGTVRIQTPITFLETYKDNLLYRQFGIRVLGKQNSETGEIDTSSLMFLELVEFQSDYDEEYLKVLREKAKNSWLGKIDPDSWLREVRGGYDA